MEYLKREKQGLDERIIKYNVSYNADQLQHIRHEIIQHCGPREIAVRVTDEPQYEDSLLKRHIKVTKKDDTRNPVFYREESVQIIEPKLSKLINAFLTTKYKDEDRTMLLDYIFGDKVLEDYEYNTLSGFERRRDEILSAMRVIIEDGRLEEYQEFVSFREKLDELETNLT